MPKTIDNSPVVLQDIYIADGQAVSKADIEPYLPSAEKGDKQGTEKTVYWRVINFDNIKAIKYAGETVTFA